MNLHTMNSCSLVFTTMSIVGYSQVPTSAADGPYQIRYASNVSAGDSYVDITNDGASMTTTTIAAGQNTLSVSGSICANVYTFNPSEEILSCCSCPITPNGLISLSVQRDLLSNTLTGYATPNSVVIKLVATAPPGAGVGTSSNPCGTSASTVGAGGALATGMVTWGISLHANTSAVAGTYHLTETPFTVASYNPSELLRLGNLCAIVQAQGSTFGICPSCADTGVGGGGLPSD